ncbi:sca1 complex scaffold protein scaa [Anaeramoeba ignava]|uniref:Sca1 complex scaffold protein scaa n=1 Tax=Anaeramoeba ignava TaxID=1746090 RepID=A0A9Q0RGN8_ANAIG|nr:sca1 complex scaffold protein scaa [Anaeramoeba ignava]
MSKTIDSQNQKSKKKYTSLTGIYKGPSIKTKKIPISVKEKKGQHQFPYFVDSNGGIYDVNYLPISQEKLSFSLENVSKNDDYSELSNVDISKFYCHWEEQQELLKKYAPKKLESIPKFPDPENYKRFKDFENAILDWHKIVENHIGYLQLPKTISRAYPRPIQRIRNKFDTSQFTLTSTEFESESSVISFSSDEITETDFTSDEFESADFFDIKIPNENSPRITSVQLSESIDSDDNQINPKKINSKKNKEQQKARFETIPNPQNNKIQLNDSISESEFQTKKENEIEEKELDPEQEYELMNYFSTNEKILDTFLFEDQIEKILRKNDPWNSLLIPPEPKPEFYQTLSEYDRAFRRWAQICVSKLSTIPLHSKQLEAQIALKSQPNDISLTQEGDHSEDLYRNFYTWSQDYLKSLEELFIHPNFQSSLKTELKENGYKFNFSNQKRTKEELRKKLSNETSDSIKEFFSKVLVKQKNIIEKQIRIKSQEMELIELENSFNQIQDCNLNNQENFPEFFNLDKIKKDKLYLEEVKNEILKFEHGNRFKKFYSKNVSENTQKSTEKKASKIVRKLIDLNISNLKKFIQTEQCLDKFFEMIKNWRMKTPTKKGKITLSDILQQTITQTNFHEILDIFETCKSVSVHAKISSFVIDLFQKITGKTLLEQFTQNLELKYLYRISYAMNFFKPIPVDIFPYIPDLQFRLKIKFGENQQLNEFLKVIQAHYYLQLIYDSLNTENVLFRSIYSFQPIAKFVLYQIKKLFVDIINMITESPEIIQKYVFRGIGSSSVFISTHFLFVLLHILKIESDELFRILKSPEVGLIFKLRRLGSSKLHHVQEASNKLWIAMRNPRFFVFFAENYATATHVLFEDLFSHSKMEFVQKSMASPKRTESLNTAISCEKYSFVRKHRTKRLEHVKFTSNRKKRQEKNNQEVSKLIFKKDVKFELPPHISSLVVDLCCHIYRFLITNEVNSTFKHIAITRETFLIELLMRIHIGTQHFYSPGMKNLAKLLLSFVRFLSNNQNLQASNTHYQSNNDFSYSQPQTSVMSQISPLQKSHSSFSMMQIGPQKLQKKQKIENEPEIKSKNPKNNHLSTINITSEDIGRLLLIIENSPSNEYEFKADILDVIRFLIREKTIMKLIYKNEEFLKKIKEFCSNEESLIFAKHSWKLFYQMIYYNDIFCSYLISKNKIKPFLLMGISFKPKKGSKTKYPAYLPYSIKCITKLLSMDDCLSRKLAENPEMKLPRSNLRDPQKSLKKDVELFVDFFIKSKMFIHFHFLFLKLKESQPGVVFSHFAQFMLLVFSSPHCVKLIKEVKKDGYYEGIEYFLKINNLINSRNDLESKIILDSDEKKNN